MFAADGDTRILLISETERVKFERYYHTPPGRMVMLPPGISPDRCAPEDAPERRAAIRRSLDLAPEDHVLLFVGSGFVKKGLDRAIQTGLRQVAEAKGFTFEDGR